MASKNVENLRAAHKSWNKRDFVGIVKNAAEGLVYTDNATSVTLNSQDKFREWTEEWAKAFPDGLITNAEYIDAGDVVIAQFHGGRYKPRTIRFNEAHRTHDVFAVLRDLSLRQTRSDCVGWLLL